MKGFLKFLGRNKFYTAVEVVGLTVSMAFVLLIGSCVVRQYAVTRENPQWRDVYAFGMNGEEGQSAYLGLTYNFTAALADRAPGVEEATGVSIMDLHGKDGSGEYKALIADKEFFEVFPNYRIPEGTVSCLAAPDGALISRTMAQKTGLKVGDRLAMIDDSFTVGGIAEDFRGTLFPCVDVILSKTGKYRTWADPDDQFGTVMTFVKVRHGTERDALSEVADAICAERYPDVHGTMFFTSVAVWGLDELLFSSCISDLNSCDRKMLWLLLSAVLLLLVSAIINYVNLNLAMSGTRAKEMALRRLNGASKAQVFGENMVESLALTAVCFICAALLAVALTPMMNRLLNDPQIAVGLRLTALFVAMFVCLVLLTGGLAGLLPAISASRFKPVDVLKGTLRRDDKMVMGKVFIVLQNVLSVLLIGYAIVMETQYRKSVDRPWNADLSDKYFVRLYGAGDQGSLMESLSSLPFVTELGWAQGIPGLPVGGQYSQTADGADILLRHFKMDADAFRMLKFVKVKDYNAPVRNSVWFGKAAFSASGFTDTEHDISVLSRRALGCDNMAGVIEDVPTKADNTGIEDYMIVSVMDTADMYHPGILMSVTGDRREAQARIKETVRQWMEARQGFTETYDCFLRDYVRDTMRPLRNNMRLMEVFMVLAVIISLMGLVAMSTLYCGFKSRDIAVRKVFGSTVESETAGAVRDYLILVLVACLVGIPACVWLSTRYLEQFIYRLEGTWWIFVLTVAIAVAVSFLSVIWQVLRAARTNPATELKKE